ncbi:hypothetical protein EDB80DRAFT_407876 [Ilyonectria destructans]|nr:hypothetical protein EDB80DRAFT_407876 [Ilyonectria destructans]
MLSRPTAIDTLKPRYAVTTGMAEFDLPRRKIVMSLFWLMLIQIPSLLWTEFITPAITTSDFPTTVQIPSYDKSTSNFWSRECPPATPCDDTLGTTSDLGTFTYVAWKSTLALLANTLSPFSSGCGAAKTGLLLNSVEQAPSRDTSIPRYRKLDNIGFTYHGRSYGVASTVGLVALNERVVALDTCVLGGNA